MYGSYGAHFWVPWTVVLELRAAVAAILRLEGFLLVEIAKKYKMFSVWFLVLLQGS